MDLYLLQLRARVMQRIRDFFSGRGYLELDTPALSPTLIPETCLEVFQTRYREPWSGKSRDLYLVPSPEIYIKQIIAEHRVSVFQISKCYRNAESVGRTHSPEFTMLEYYTMNASYAESAAITEELLSFIAECIPGASEQFKPPFTRIRMDDAFKKLAGFSLSECPQPRQLAKKAREAGLTAADDDAWDDLYELLFVHLVEPSLGEIAEHAGAPVFLCDYPARAACLAKDDGSWKERWELYCGGLELANCYSEETDPNRVREYFETEGKLKTETARIPHAIDGSYWKIFERFPDCSGSALGVDRLLMALLGKKSIDTVLPFPLQDSRP